MRWILILFPIPILLLTLGCPGKSGPSGPSASTPTFTMTPTATCTGGDFFGSKVDYSAGQNLQKGETKLIAGSYAFLAGGTVNTLEGLFICNDAKQDVQFALYDNSGNKLLETAAGVLPKGSGAGFGVQYGLPVVSGTATLPSGNYWLAVMIRDKSAAVGAGTQDIDASGHGVRMNATFGTFPDPANFASPPPGSPALAADYCP